MAAATPTATASPQPVPATADGTQSATASSQPVPVCKAITDPDDEVRAIIIKYKSNELGACGADGQIMKI